MSARKTIVGTNTALNGDTMSSTIELQNSPSQSVINNLNVTVRGTEEGPTTTKVETSTTNPAEPVTNTNNPYEDMVKYPAVGRSVRDSEILMFLMHTFQDIIVHDPQCVANIIDQSGLVVLSVDKLIRLIAMVCEVSEDNVKLEIQDACEGGCCGAFMKVLPLKPIYKIKVMKDSDVYNDFQLTYNNYYNKIIDDYRVSLESVYVPTI